MLQPGNALIGLIAWSVAHGVLVFAGFGDKLGFSLLMGFAGAGAVIVTGVLLARMNWLGFLRYCGEHSIVIYLAFFLPMALTRIALLKSNIVTDIGFVALIDTAAGVLGALAIWWVAKRTGLNFLFERPAIFWIGPKQVRSGLQAAE